MKEKILSAVRTLRDFCVEEEGCETCEAKAFCPNNQSSTCPEYWDIPMSDDEIVKAMYIGNVGVFASRDGFEQFKKNATPERVAEVRKRMCEL